MPQLGAQGAGPNDKAADYHGWQPLQPNHTHVHGTHRNLPIVLMIFGDLNPTTPCGSSFLTIVTLTVIWSPRTPFCPVGPSL